MTRYHPLYLVGGFAQASQALGMDRLMASNTLAGELKNRDLVKGIIRLG